MKAFGILLVAAVAIVGYFLVETGYANNTRQTMTCSVTDKDHTIAANSSGSTPVYRVYTSDCDVLGIGDNAFTGTFDSASIYGKILPGHRYTFVTVGYRIPIFSSFPNIIQAQEVS